MNKMPVEYFMGIVACDITENGLEIITLISKTEIVKPVKPEEVKG